MTHVFGLTGGIGTGKSTVARHFAARGVPLVDADQLAREVVTKGTPGLLAIASEFGDWVLTAEGELDREAVAAHVFAHPEARARLNQLTHPLVRALSVQRVQEFASLGHPLVCYDVPLLFESKLADVLRPIVVVSAPLEVQLSRAMARDGASREAVLARIESQLPLADKVSQADFVIDNSGELTETLARADQVLAALCERLGVDPGRYPTPRSP
ncbi:MAG: dephospho-CoA kinase [Polyangiaceae bacterium]|nr:dephospho-CoA kinase [Polyangiaceae bacterium]MCW5791074.1 dephospho-CoA kinase [Polyangiaceae bacterium]